MSLITTLATYIPLYIINIQYRSCDYVLLYDETYSEIWYPNEDGYKIFKSVKQYRLKND